ncbi:purine nucleoside permease [Dictyobacter kobayashii]|uniref:Purine nucleoside permease n=1 Tax=Dictyobacter kobayashii TaxID=2014872 RepID=A0A402ARM7_9CHLR|nr:purine nucleoside permease [Dictyobacter kobayashii]GCE21754.1 hypothetical protein KDK_55540 [Dictyobacter kobayashii]
MRTKFLRQSLLAVCLGLCIATTLSSGLVQAQASAGQHGHIFKVKVFIINMFALEAQQWLAHENLTMVYSVPGADNPVFCNKQGLCQTITGVDKSNAAASMSAILADTQQFDFQNTYFITAGTASASPYRGGTLGFTAWADWIVDWDQGYHLLPTDLPGNPYGYIPPKTTFRDSTAVFQLNQNLVNLAYNLTSHLTLQDSAAAIADRQLYPGQSNLHPFVGQCDTAAGDNIWAGEFFSNLAQHITDLLTNNVAHNCTYEQEDSAVATSLKRFGYLDHYLNLRGPAPSISLIPANH